LWTVLDFPCGSACKESACSVGNLGEIPALEDPLEKGKASASSILEEPLWFPFLVLVISFSKPFVCVCVCECVCAQSLNHVQLFATLMDCNLPGSSVHGIFQARILEWVAFPPSGYFPDPGIEPTSLGPPALPDRSFTTMPPGLPWWHSW